MLRTADEARKMIAQEFRILMFDALQCGRRCADAERASRDADDAWSRTRTAAEARVAEMARAISRASGPLPDVGPVTVPSGRSYRRTGGTLYVFTMEDRDPMGEMNNPDAWQPVPVEFVTDLEALVTIRDQVEP